MSITDSAKPVFAQQQRHPASDKDKELLCAKIRVEHIVQRAECHLLGRLR